MTDEIAVQKLVQKRQRRLRRRRLAESPIPAAPEPAAWLMLLTGFAAIGLALRRRVRPAAAILERSSLG